MNLVMVFCIYRAACTFASLYTSRHWVAHSSAIEEISLRRAELQVEVDTYRQVISIVGDVESQQFLFLLLLVVEQGEDKTPVSVVIVCLEVFLSFIDEHLIAEPLATHHPIGYALTNLNV